MSYRLFVSYSHEDSETAARLAEELMARGFRIWQDVHDIRLGKRIESEMEKGIASCDGVVHLLTPAALASTAVRREVALATQRRRRDPEFSVMSVARGIGQSHSEVGERTLAEFGENFSRDWLELLPEDSDPASYSEAAGFARLALRSFYPAGAGAGEGGWSIALHTRGAAPHGADLDLDWRPLLGLGARNPGDYEGWVRAWVAVREVRHTLAEHSGRRDIALEAVAHQSAGILFGAAFCANGRWRLTITGQDGAPWAPQGDGDLEEFRLNRQPESLEGIYLTVEIELVRKILPAVAEHIATTGEEPRARLLVTRDGLSGEIEPGAGGTLARVVAGEIKEAVDDLGVDRVELYSAAPFPISVLLAAQLGALHAELAVFEYHDGYQQSIAIPEEGEMSLSVGEAFAALKSNLEIKREDEQLAIKRRGDIHERLKKDVDLLAAPVLTGSFHRDTKTRPLKDVDFFCPIRRTDENVGDFLDSPPSVALEAFADSLRKRYGDRVSISRRSVGVDFGSEDSRILSYDIVPAFERSEGSGFEIPDATLGRWIGSDPREHRVKATEANQACDGKWKPLVKMIKRANGQIAEQTGRKAIKPSFLIEVMGLELIVPPLGDWPEELQAAFATYPRYVEEKWADPSGLGPPVNEMDATQQAHAREQLKIAQEVAQDARHLARKSDRQAIMKWRELFGSYMPLD